MTSGSSGATSKISHAARPSIKPWGDLPAADRTAPARAGAGDKGVAIVGVDPDGAAAAASLTAGDVILDVAGKPVSTPEDVKSGSASAKSQGKKGVLMRVQTADGERYVAVAFPDA
jgi:serine protease Do